MTIYFITGNPGKYREIEPFIPDLEMLDIDLPEIQELNAKAILEAKAREAFKHNQGRFIVEDTSLHFDGLNGLPGPLIKWFMQTVGYKGLYNLAQSLHTNRATARTFIAYAEFPDNIWYFEGVIHGKIVEPRGEGFGWDPIFQPDGYDRTFGEMDLEEKNKISMRMQAACKLSDFLKQPPL